MVWAASRAAMRSVCGRSTRSLDVIGDTVEVTLHSVITCPECGATSQEVMPTDACIAFYECNGCHKVLRPLAGDCCVFCSFGSVRCPPIQLEKGCCA